MDDSLESPSANTFGDLHSDDDENSSGDDDGALDWTKLSFGSVRPVIPKRGEKEFEPAPGGGSGLQLHVLDRARLAMFDALRATPGSSSKSISYGIWRPELSRVQITVARGMQFSTIGHSAPRPSSIAGKFHKKLELLPEEAIYLIERGTLFCCKASGQSVAGMEDTEGPPMSVQQAYSEMIGTENLTLEKYQVFAYFKRLGYVVTRTEPPTSSYPSPPPIQKLLREPSCLGRLFSSFSLWMDRAFRLFARPFDWWKPLYFSRWLHHDKNYGYLFKSLRFIPSGHSIPLSAPKPTTSPYKIFFNLYKPSTPFRKSAPPPPDFSVVVINARTTPMPSLAELDSLFNTLPEIPPPLPRQKRQAPPKPPTVSPASCPNEHSYVRRFFSWFFFPPPQNSKPNPFVALKAGKKNVIIAAADFGNISFFRFGQGAFSEWPMT